jgi:hypothetical protein
MPFISVYPYLSVHSPFTFIPQCKIPSVIHRNLNLDYPTYPTRTFILYRHILWNK